MDLFFSHQPGSQRTDSVEQAREAHKEACQRRLAMLTNGVDPDEARKRSKPRKPKY